MTTMDRQAASLPRLPSYFQATRVSDHPATDEITAEEVDQLLQSATAKDITRLLRSRGIRLPARSGAKPKRPMHGICEIGDKWLVRLFRNKQRIINRYFASLEEAIRARDHALATAPPRKQVGRPRGSRNRPRGPL
jgi:hypothetical protein